MPTEDVIDRVRPNLTDIAGDLRGLMAKDHRLSGLVSEFFQLATEIAALKESGVRRDAPQVLALKARRQAIHDDVMMVLYLSKRPWIS